MTRRRARVAPEFEGVLVEHVETIEARMPQYLESAGSWIMDHGSVGKEGGEHVLRVLRISHRGARSAAQGSRVVHDNACQSQLGAVSRSAAHGALVEFCMNCQQPEGLGNRTFRSSPRCKWRLVRIGMNVLRSGAITAIRTEFGAQGFASAS